MNKIKNILLEVIFIIIALFIITSEGITPNPLTAWNLLPVLIYYLLLKNGLPFWKNLIVKIILSLTGVLLILCPVVMHFMWLTDFEGTKTGSSTSGLLFVFVPFWALLFSFIPAFIQVIYVNNYLKINNKK